MTLNNLIKRTIFALLLLSAGSQLFAATPEGWHDMSDPRVIFTGVTVGGGSEGVNITANVGGYLTEQYKQKITLQAMNDLEYYTANYMILDVKSNTGFTLESVWNRDLWDIESFNDSSVGVFAQIPVTQDQLTFHPKMNLGMIWGDDVTSTTYIKLDLTTRLRMGGIFWVGVTPTYTYAMQGLDLNKFQASIDAGVQLSPEFALAAHANNDEEFWFDVVFAF